MYQPKPLDVVKYTIDHDWYIVLVHEIRPVEVEIATGHPRTIDEVLIEDIAVSNPSDFYEGVIWVDEPFAPEYLISIELLMSNCPDVDTFITTHPEYLL